MIQVYWKNCRSEVIGQEHGITPQELSALEPALTAAHEAVQGPVEKGERGFANLPTHLEYRRQVQALVEKYRGRVTDMVILGIGGSALGNIALQAALNPLTYNLDDAARGDRPRLFVLDNVDPALIGEVIDVIRPRLKTTLVNVISKSGETAETASQFMIFRDLLRRELGGAFTGNIVATTDMVEGTLHKIAKEEKYDMLPVPDDVGGRFSVLTPVGLFSAAMCGIDIDQLLAGAAAMKQRCAVRDWRKNPATLLAGLKFIAACRKTPAKMMDVMMSYSNRLYYLADWYRQLWAESLGKKTNNKGQDVYVGPTPIKALGTTDQHSQVQLYREGPNDKFFQFLEVAKHPQDVTIPNDFANVSGMGYLGGQTLGKLLNDEKLATEYALAESQRPSVTVRFDAITPFSVGEFIYLYEMVTSIAGELLDVNTYDQPAVELGKQATFALMGRTEFDKQDMKEKVEDLKKQIPPFAKVDTEFLV
ncbi:MAG: glucose-6-phosphate isomerase [Phycisphaerae bacterium]|nr:glucose-6-phosphate isomerase [Phycisphaerae bacterium]